VIAVDRRNLLRAAVAAPAVPLLTGSAAQAADKAHSGTGERFALAVLPDTQYLFDADSADPAPLRETFRCRPFVLGATSFDLRYGQGFYGWLGDVRITARALAARQLLQRVR
jgi:hypothetical protein